MPEKNNPVAFCPEGIATFPERLKELIGDESLRSFGKMVGISEGGLRKYLPPGTSKPTFDKLVAIARYKGVNLEWLATGEGPKESLPDSFWFNSDIDTKAKEQQAHISKAADVGIQMWVETDWSDLERKDQLRRQRNFEEEYALIEGYHVAVSTGHGAFGEGAEVTRRLAFRRRWLSYRGFKPEQLKVVFARGDSMEPTIKDGDSLLINLASTSPVDGKIFVVRLGDQLYAKRIQKRWDGGIELISDNKEYNTQVIPAAELEHLQVIGQVVWIGKDIS
jgi:phage repressor protein C with HTH and peptisase S24 domain